MSKFKSGDVVLNTKTGAVHLYISDNQIMHIMGHAIDHSSKAMDTSVYPSIYTVDLLAQKHHKLMLNLGQFLAKYLGHTDTIHEERAESVRFFPNY